MLSVARMLCFKGKESEAKEELSDWLICRPDGLYW